MLLLDLIMPRWWWCGDEVLRVCGEFLKVQPGGSIYSYRHILLPDLMMPGFGAGV